MKMPLPNLRSRMRRVIWWRTKSGWRNTQMSPGASSLPNRKPDNTAKRAAQ